MLISARESFHYSGSSTQCPKDFVRRLEKPHTLEFGFNYGLQYRIYQKTNLEYRLGAGFRSAVWVNNTITDEPALIYRQINHHYWGLSLLILHQLQKKNTLIDTRI